jgi:hypothetical protein
LHQFAAGQPLRDRRFVDPAHLRSGVERVDGIVRHARIIGARIRARRLDGG